jgi:peptide/nickel transport system substrate-binding protein
VRARLLQGSSILALLAVACTACGQSASNQPKKGGTLVVEQVFAIDSLDPAHGSTSTSILVDKSVYDTLLTLNPKDLTKPYPALATSYTASTDGKTFTFDLRHGVKFANGDPLTSADVVYSLQRLQKINNPSSASFVGGLVITAPDAYTVVVASPAPNPAIPVIMTQFNQVIYDSKLVAANGGTEVAASDKAETFFSGPNAAGSGPYMITSVDATSQIVLKANPHYWGAKPVYNEIVIRNVPAATQRLDIQDGQAQVALNINENDASSLGSSVTVSVAPSEDQYYIELNHDPAISKFTSNVNFRQAVQLALNYGGLVALGGKGAVQESGFIPKGMLGALPASDNTKQNLAQARADLALVGIANPTFQLDYSTDNAIDGVDATAVATTIQSDLQAIGITVKLNQGPFASVLLPRVLAGKSEAILFANPADYPDPSDFLAQVPGPGGYVAGFFGWKTGASPAIDTLVAQASGTVDSTQRGQAYQQIQQLENQTADAIYLFQPGRVLAVASSVHATLNPFTFVDLGSVT